MKRHSLVLPASERWEYPGDAYFRLDFASRHISSSLCVTDPLPTGLNGDGKNVQTLWWAELDRLHSMTRAHPPLGLWINFTSLFRPDPLPSRELETIILQIQCCSAILQNLVGNSEETQCLEEISRGKCRCSLSSSSNC